MQKSKSYKYRYSDRRDCRVINQIRRIIYSNLSPMMQIVALMFLLSKVPRY